MVEKCIFCKKQIGIFFIIKIKVVVIILESKFSLNKQESTLLNFKIIEKNY